MDALDQQLVQLLQTDGRMSNAVMARNLGVSEGTVRRRVGRLLKSETIRVVAIPHYSNLGYGTIALIGIQADPNKIDSAAATIATFRDAQSVVTTTGMYDIFVWAALRSTDALGAFIRDKIGSVPGVRRTETFVHLSVLKVGYGPPLGE